ncbi:MAG: hypothetical protein DM484_00625 [Candidatus Methylumidiphilus alinenensis]|uniref:Uncharacterized protein n=1 Tax=Candidatus Methylumidiphilus alinenensis TaxID=2202197 RepID=A0A2W4S6E7_9GAMM|nr:MAG: hypothetical protein DM484_00625 [Candidatus Methylumidiphilus alinenensis]
MTKTAREMPRYKCHKEVLALKIKEIIHCLDCDDVVLRPTEEGYEDIIVSAKFFNKHKPEAGGYYVAYADGYKSFSPAEAFENGYTKITA